MIVLTLQSTIQDEEELKYTLDSPQRIFSTITLVFLSSRNEYVNNGLCIQSFIIIVAKKMNPLAKPDARIASYN